MQIIINICFFQSVNPQLQTMADRCGGGGGWNRNRYGNNQGGFRRGGNFGRNGGQGGGHKRF